jgi:hypothetical protein
MRRACLVAIVLSLASVAGAAPAAAQRPAAPVVTSASSVPLAEVLDVAKPYPNLLLQVRLQLVRANLKRDVVTCASGRYDGRWVGLSGTKQAPYECRIGSRTLVITAAQTFFDRNGRRLTAADAATPAKAVKVKESGLKWSWK